MPKNTPEEAAYKEQQLEECSKLACSVPMEIMRKSYEGIKVHERMGEIGTAIAISDVGCGVTFLKSALISGYLNVLINVNTIKDEKFVADTLGEANKLLEDGSKIADETLQKVIDKIKK